MVEWSISLQPQEELAAFARFGNAVASLCVEKKGARACLKKSPTNWDSQLTKSLFQTRSIPAMPDLAQVEKRLGDKKWN